MPGEAREGAAGQAVAFELNYEPKITKDICGLYSLATVTPKRPRRPAMKHSGTDAGAKGAQASESHLLENGVSFPCGRRAPNRFAKVHI